MAVPIGECPAQEYPRLPTTLPDTTFINTFIKIADSIDRLNPDSAGKHYEKALIMSESAHYSVGVVYSSTKAGLYYQDKKDYARSKALLYKAIPYCWKLQKQYHYLIPFVYNSLGNAYFMTGSRDSAILYYNLALRTMDSLSLSLPRLQAIIYGNMGGVMSDSWQYRQGGNYIRKSLALINHKKKKEPLSHKDSILEAANYQNLGALYANYLNDMDSALYWWSLAIDIYKDLSIKADLQYIYANIARGWLTPPHENIGLAKSYLDTAIRIDPESATYDINIQLGLGSIYYYKGDYKSAIEHCKRVITLCNDRGQRERKQVAYNVLSYCYAHLDDTLNSHKYQRLYVLLSDSLLNEEITHSISQTEVLYRISEKNKKLAEQQASLYRQRYWLAGSIGFGLILLLSLLAIIRNNKQKRRLQAEQMQNWKQQRKIESLRVKAEAEEQERTRIARDLHDGVGVLVSAAMMNYTVLGKKTAAVAVSTTDTYREGMEILQEMRNEIRTIAHNLMPETSARHNLTEAIQTLVNRIEQGNHINISFDFYGRVTAMEPERSLSVYRMIEELMQNIMKHAKATKALIQLMFHEHQLNITVEDNGRGFNPNATSDGMGLKNLNSRTEKLNGYLSITSRQGHGTTVEIEIPYSEEGD